MYSIMGVFGRYSWYILLSKLQKSAGLEGPYRAAVPEYLGSHHLYQLDVFGFY